MGTIERRSKCIIFTVYRSMHMARREGGQGQKQAGRETKAGAFRAGVWASTVWASYPVLNCQDSCRGGWPHQFTVTGA